MLEEAATWVTIVVNRAQVTRLPHHRCLSLHPPLQIPKLFVVALQDSFLVISVMAVLAETLAEQVIVTYPCSVANQMKLRMDCPRSLTAGAWQFVEGPESMTAVADTFDCCQAPKLVSSRPWEESSVA